MIDDKMGEGFWVKVTLPSKCLPYDGVNCDEVAIRTLRGADEKVLAELAVDNFDKKANELLKRVFKGVEPIDLTPGDRLFLLVWETINSYSKIFPLDLMCPSCFRKIVVDVDLSKLQVRYLPDDFKQPYEVKLSNGYIKLKLFTIKDEIATSQFEGTGQSSWLFRYACTIVDERSIWDKIKFLEELSTKDLSLIRAFHEKYLHGLNMNYAYECPKCRGGDTLEVPFRLEMLLPTGSTVARTAGVEV